jgi:hypothetical protein
VNYRRTARGIFGLAGLEKASQLLEVKAALEQLSFSPGLHSSTSTYSRQLTTAELTTDYLPLPPLKKKNT